MRQVIAGNWKMNGLSSSLDEVRTVTQALSAKPPVCDVLICPPATLIARAAEIGNSYVMFGGQDCRAEESGAFTGDISAEMLRDAGAKAVIVGHSERRKYHGETDAIVSAKARAAWRAGLLAIICVGETLEQRNARTAEAVCKSQLAGSVPDGATPLNTTIAYEPVWAIGTGKTPSVSEIVAMHSHIRTCVGSEFQILYGGSVTTSNAKQILALQEVGGALVGGASLKAADFLAIVAASQSRT